MFEYRLNPQNTTPKTEELSTVSSPAKVQAQHNMSEPDSPATSTPSPFNYILSFLLVGLAWGFTTPFIRRAAVHHSSPSASTHPSAFDPSRSWVARKISFLFYTVLGLLKSPSYAVPLLLNLTGSVWFFLLIGQAGKLYSFLFGLSFLCLVFKIPHSYGFRSKSSKNGYGNRGHEPEVR